MGEIPKPQTSRDITPTVALGKDNGNGIEAGMNCRDFGTKTLLAPLIGNL